MAEGKGKVIEIEPSFDIDDLMELLPDDPMGAANIGMEKEGMLGSSSNINNLNQEIKPVKSENYQIDGTQSNLNNLNQENQPMKLENYQVVGTQSNINNLNQENKPMKLENYQLVGTLENKPMKLENYQVLGTQSDIMPPVSRNWKPVDSPSDNSANSIAHSVQRSTLPNMYTEFSQSPTSCNIVSQPHQQLHHQFPNQTALRPNMPPISAKFNVYHNIQRQQQPVPQKQNTAFAMHQQQQKIGYHLDSPPMKHHEQFNFLKQHGQMTPEKNLQQMSKPMQMRQILETSCDPGNNCVQRKLMTSAFPRSQNPMLVDQQKQQVERSQAVLLGLSQGLESIYHFMLTNSTDWVDQVFKQIELMNDLFSAELFALYKRASELMDQATTETEKRSERGKYWFYRKILQLIKIPKSELVQHPKENISQYINDIVVNLKKIVTRIPSQHHQQLKASGNTSRTPSLQQQKGNVFQFTQVNPFHNNTPTSVPQLMMQQGNMNLQGNSMNQLQIGSSTGMQKSDPSSLLSSFQYNNLMKPRQQFSPSQSQQGMTLPQKGPQLFGQHNAVLSTNSFNSLDFAVRSLGPNPVVTSSQHSRRPDQQLAMQKKMKQPMQQMLTERNKQQMVQKMNEEAKMAQFAGYNQRMQAKGPHLEPYPWPLLQSSSTTPYRGTSPQSSQHSSTQLELKELSAKLSRSATPLLSTASPSAVPSPLTPVTPSSLPTEQEKVPSCLNQVSVEERNKVTQAPIEQQSLLQSRVVSENQVTVTQELPKTPLLTESTCPVECQQSRAKSDPAQRLIEVVKSMSRNALHASLQDINAVTCLIDRKPGSYLQGRSKWVVAQDFDLVHMKTRMKRQLGPIHVDDMTSGLSRSDTFGSDQTFEVESDAKRLKIEPGKLLLEEIKEINHKLIETVVDVVDVKDVSGAGSAAGTVIRCLYNAAVQYDGNTGASTQMFSNLTVELLVTADYPNSSPVVLERLPPGCSEDEEVKLLWTKAKSNFSLLLRKFPQPVSLKEMAKTWDVCAREVFREFVQKFGGGDFSSKYGKWEDCLIAT